MERRRAEENRWDRNAAKQEMTFAPAYAYLMSPSLGTAGETGTPKTQLKEGLGVASHTTYPLKT